MCMCVVVCVVVCLVVCVVACARSRYGVKAGGATQAQDVQENVVQLYTWDDVVASGSESCSADFRLMFLMESWRKGWIDSATCGRPS